jgi:ParB/RepB/Spo0J family partition protein
MKPPAYGKLQFRCVPTHQLRMPCPDHRDRTDPVYVEYRDRHLRPDIRARGIQQPPLVVAEANDIYRVIDGGSRLESAMLECIPEVWVLVHDPTTGPLDLEVATFQANEMRLDFTVIERAQFYLRVLAERKWSRAELCRQLHLTPAKVSKTLTVFDQLPPEVLELIGEGDGRLPFRAAYALTGVSDPAIRADLVARVTSGNLTVEALEEEIAQLLGKKPRRAKPVTVKLPGGAELELPAALTWDAVGALGKSLSAAAAKGARGNRPLRALSELLGES